MHTKKWTHTWVFYHLLFWASTTISLLYDIIEYFPYDPFAYSASVIIRIALLAGLVYGNLYVLIPVFYSKNKLLYWTFLLLLIGLFVLSYRFVYFSTTQMVSEVPTPFWRGAVTRLTTAIRFLLISVFLKFIQDWFYQEKKISEMTNLQLTTELHYLRSQINPHFLFNTLNNIYSLTLQKSDKAPEVVLRLSEMMEYMLVKNDESKVLLEKEINNLVNYLEIERIRQGNNATIEFEALGDIKGKRIIPMLLLPLLENAVKHGVNKAVVGAYLKANLQQIGNKLTFRVENNNSAVKDDNQNGIGLVNLRKRLNLFYKNTHHFHIEQDDEKYIATLQLELS